MFNFDAQHSKAEIGYELLPEHHGKGIMQEAFASVVSHVFDTMQLTAIEAFTHEENIASIKLLQKNEFTQIPHTEESRTDGKTFSAWMRHRQPVTG